MPTAARIVIALLLGLPLLAPSRRRLGPGTAPGAGA